MSTNKKSTVVNDLLGLLFGEADDTSHNGGLPAVQAPQKTTTQRARTSRTLLDAIALKLDKYRRQADATEFQNFCIELATQTSLLKKQAEEALAKSDIHKHAVIQAYQTEAACYIQTAAKKTQAQAILQQADDLAEVLEAVAQRGFEPRFQRLVATLIARVYADGDLAEEGDDDAKP